MYQIYHQLTKYLTKKLTKNTGVKTLVNEQTLPFFNIKID